MRPDFYPKLKARGLLPWAKDDPIFVDINNVAKMVGDKSSRIHELPRITPPWIHTWLEYDASHVIHNEAKGCTIGFSVARLEVTALMKMGLEPTINERATPELKEMIGISRVGNFLVSVKGYLMKPNGDFSEEVKHIILQLDKHGKYTDFLQYSTSTGETEDYLYDDVPFFVEIVGPVFEAMALLNCKNIVTVDNLPPPKVMKARAKKGIPSVQYKTIAITPMRQVKLRPGQAAPTGIKKSLHIRRGHYRTYSKEKPLFGKVSGTFYVEQHLAGHRDVGEIRKDYRIDPS